MLEGFHFRHAYYLYMLTMLVPLAMLFYWLIEQRRRQLVRLMGAQAQARAARTVSYHRVRALLLLGAVAMGVVALARPQWGRYQDSVQSRGIDVIIAIDVSLSMLAEDELPSRLARAKRLGADLIERLRDNRIGLIAFAGSGAALMPLTLDTAALKSFLDPLDCRAVGDTSTSLVQAINRANESFKSVGRQSRLLIVISDGEDQAENAVDAVRAASMEASNNGVMILSVGVGTASGGMIPLASLGASGFKLDNEGKPVVTRLDEAVLQTAAEMTRGIYLHTQPDGGEVAVITSLVERLEKGDLRDVLRRDREERFQYPLAIAILLLLADALMALRRP